MFEIMTKLNLRLFNNTQTTLLNDLSAEMKTYYEKQLVRNAEPALVYDRFGDKYPIPKNGGKNIEFRKYDPLPKALTKITEGVTPSGNKLKVTTITATIDQYGDYIEISDVLELTAIDRNLEESTMLLGSQSGRTRDTIVREIVCAGTNKSFAPSVDGTTITPILLRKDVTTKCKLRPKDVREMVAKLKRMNANPMEDGYFVAVIHPDVSCDIQDDKEWQESHKYAEPENLYNGEIGRIGKVKFVESTEAKIIGPKWIFGNAESNGVCRLHVEETEAIGSTEIKVKEAISTAQATEFNARITGGETIYLYFNKVRMAITSVTAGAAGAGYFTVSAIAAALAAGDMICGDGAGADGSAIYCTMVFGAHAYGITEVNGGGLQHIVKPLGSAGAADPLNQRATSGWKCLMVAERLVEAYMGRIEHSSEVYGAEAVSN